MKGVLALLYGLVSYVIFLATFLYAIGFVGNLWVPKSVDSGVGVPFAEAMLIDTLLLGIFAAQHSVMARRGFKKWWTRYVPEPIERSTYVLLSSLALILLFWQWRPLRSVIWNVENPIGQDALWVLFGVGWSMVLVSTFLINHFELFGLRQVFQYSRGADYEKIGFRTPFFYKFIRHPLMFGFIVAFWATPKMTLGHLVFSIATTAYILIAIQIEERDLLRLHGQPYDEYRQRVSMILPLPRWHKHKPGNRGFPRVHPTK